MEIRDSVHMSSLSQIISAPLVHPVEACHDQVYTSLDGVREAVEPNGLRVKYATRANLHFFDRKLPKTKFQILTKNMVQPLKSRMPLQ